MRPLLATIIVVVTILPIAFFLWRKKTIRVSAIPAYIDTYWDMVKERRRSIRLNKRVSTTCAVIEKEGAVHHIFSRDLSGEGICLQIPEILPEGGQLDIKINIPKARPISVKGKVVWVNEHKKDVSSAKRLFDTGIIFTEMQPQERKRLKDFLSSTLFL